MQKNENWVHMQQKYIASLYKKIDCKSVFFKADMAISMSNLNQKGAISRY